MQAPLVSDAASSGYRRRSMQAAMDTTGEHASASGGKVHPAMDGPAPATSREAAPADGQLEARLQLSLSCLTGRLQLPSAASRFDAVAP